MLAWINGLAERLTERERAIGYQLFKEIRARLGFLVDVGLDYLTIDRTSSTLSGGEAQRIRLATQIGSSLMGVLYILDEPSIGLHQRDNAQADRNASRASGTSAIPCSSSSTTRRRSARPTGSLDIGPGAGEHGGEIVAAGPIDAILREPRSITGAYLRGERAVPIPAKRRKGSGKKLVLEGRPAAQPQEHRPLSSRSGDSSP